MQENIKMNFPCW